MAVDAEAAVRDWVNGRTDLVGPGSPIQLGAHLGHGLRSPGRGAYVLLLRVGGVRALTAERPFDQARISATFRGTTKEMAANAAIAYVTALEGLSGAPVAMGPLVVCHVVDNITGPTAIDDGSAEYRYLADAEFVLSLAASLTS